MTSTEIVLFNCFLLTLIAHQLWVGIVVRKRVAEHKNASYAEAIQNNFSRARCELYDLYIREAVSDDDPVYKKIDEINTYFMQHKSQYPELAMMASGYLEVVLLLREAESTSDLFRTTLHKTAVALRSVELALGSEMGLPQSFDAAELPNDFASVLASHFWFGIRMRSSTKLQLMWRSLQSIASIRRELHAL